ncbi:hypothetical protein CfE428DRAFT_2065 [Chthoniobacter flavus Ellin428]|uniref:Uncharacterized protein n=1 Tax=Chthoniobacter flavus Ellin428 TaxID=497964 RepID=B4CZH7_9BACT|nr:hypothetical protein [Chthoniobacter flavus]EDY20141.1 hypothetical protein CfE428DRAFT_2065 [Chthoniobacter flavus Ellin428]TCO94039.1 hypothetical protein EV701_103126 [Chthoniobacter flavus]
MNALLTYFAGIATTIAGAYLVHFLTHRRWWKEYRLRKLEELYLALQSHEIAISEYYTRSAAYLIRPEDAEGLEEQEETLRTDYLKALQEDEKKAAVIPMIVNIYFRDLSPAWQNVEAAKEKLRVENRKAVLIDDRKREALGRTQREAISKAVALAILREHIPELAAFTKEMFAKIIRIADEVKENSLWLSENG